MKYIMIAVLAILLSACTTTNEVFTCSNTRESFSFTPDRVTLVQSENTKVDFYLIDSTDGRHINSSSVELANYTCQ